MLGRGAGDGGQVDVPVERHEGAVVVEGEQVGVGQLSMAQQMAGVEGGAGDREGARPELVGRVGGGLTDQRDGLVDAD